MNKYTILPALLMPVIVSCAFWFYNGCVLNWRLLWALIPALMISSGIVLAAKIHKTPAITNKFTVYFYMFLLIGPFVWVGICSMLGIMPLATIIVFLALPVAIACARTLEKKFVDKDGDVRVIADLAARSANFHLMFSSLFAVSLLIGRLL